MSQKRSVLYPCVIYQLTEDNPEEYQRGWRYRVHDIDDDTFYFHDKERMGEQLAQHGFKPVTPEAMEKLRASRLKSK